MIQMLSLALLSGVMRLSGSRRRLQHVTVDAVDSVNPLVLASDRPHQPAIH